MDTSGDPSSDPGDGPPSESAPTSGEPGAATPERFAAPSWADPRRQPTHGVDYSTLRHDSSSAEGFSFVAAVMIGGLVLLAVFMAVLIRWGL